MNQTIQIVMVTLGYVRKTVVVFLILESNDKFATEGLSRKRAVFKTNQKSAIGKGLYVDFDRYYLDSELSSQL